MSIVNRGYGRGTVASSTTPGSISLAGYGNRPLFIKFFGTVIKIITVQLNTIKRIEVEA